MHPLTRLQDPKCGAVSETALLFLHPLFRPVAEIARQLHNSNFIICGLVWSVSASGQFLGPWRKPPTSSGEVNFERLALPSDFLSECSQCPRDRADKSQFTRACADKSPLGWEDSAQYNQVFCAQPFRSDPDYDVTRIGKRFFGTVGPSRPYGL